MFCSTLNTFLNLKPYKDISSKIRKHYFGGDGTISRSHKTNHIDFLSDTFFAYGIHKAIQIHASKSTGKTYNWMYVPHFLNMKDIH